MSVSDRLRDVRALVMDIDGVLTDGTFTWSSDGAESKSYSFEDVMGLSRARAAGISLALISGEGGPLVDRLSKKIQAVFVVSDCKDKAQALRKFSDASGIPLAHMVYIGDDVNDLETLALAGVSAAPANAQPPVRESVAMVMDKAGGRGAVRQLVEIILAARNSS
ncbi:MAG: KdsC family phosphatase [Candidatus Nanopelagicales bacterium]